MSKLRRKKNKIYLANPKEKTIFAPYDESWNGWWLFIGCSLIAICSRTWN